MLTRKTQLLSAEHKDDLDVALEILLKGGLVSVPTETVYGLAANAKNSTAVKSIFTAKGRPASHPLIVHIAGADQLSEWAIDIPSVAYVLAERFWPGPLTLLLKKSPEVPSEVTAGKASIGLRVPAHPALLQLLKRGKIGVAAPSANPYKRLSPTSASQVFAELQGKIDAVLDGGPCEVGLESTILDLTGEQLSILREGPITAQQIAELTGFPVNIPAQHDIAVPGNVAEHYQPRTPLYVGTREQILARLPNNDESVACVFYADTPQIPVSPYIRCLPESKPAYAQALYDTLYKLDHLHASAIWIEQPPQTAQWGDVNDRLRRAALPI